MDPKPTGAALLLAPAARGGAAARLPPAELRQARFPAVDEHLVAPEVTRDELIRGRKVVAAPALEPHAEQQVRLDFLIAPHLQPGYIGAADLITRVAEGSDFATDLSIRKAGIDPATGRRYLEELSFEIVNEQSMHDVREKAEDLVARGVRRVFAIFVKRDGVAEWSAAEGRFVPLAPDAMIEDPSLVRPVPVRALLDGAAAEREVVRALERKGNPEIEAIKARERQAALDEGRRAGLDEGRRAGLDDGQRAVLLRQLRARFGDVPEGRREQVLAASGERLAGWAERILTATTLDELFEG
ncbi:MULTISPECIES: hypothetical protein [Sorangium]|uniref:DUF4351 domain-containing protein n=1 Tax=Sorangium cellulosum TaxID=56 RepID=A0A4P2R3T3_SORCE|nr:MULTISPECIES: hypothetical protein [Sorangium]AUX37368.1 uncharacterized protein SOCE836_095910 [Sorangium cellulosum]WCQ96655.1 hypothetical protein NQZ70_09442 [Sorangium sp. Soce836]